MDSNVKDETSYQYSKFQFEEMTVVRAPYLHNDISYTGKMASLFWINSQMTEYQARTLPR